MQFDQFSLPGVNPQESSPRGRREAANQIDSLLTALELKKELGGWHTGIRFAAAITCVCDERLRFTSRKVYMVMCWRYYPGKPWRLHQTNFAAEVGVAPRSVRRAISECRDFGYVLDTPSGLILPPVEKCMPRRQRADCDAAEQVAFDIPKTTPISVRRFWKKRSCEHINYAKLYAAQERNAWKR